MSEDIKNAITDLGTTFAEFKKVNDQRLEQIEKGESTALVDEKLAKMEAKMDSYEDINQKLTTAELNADNIKSQIEKLETIVTRPNSGFESKQVDEYMGAFDTYCRKGLEGPACGCSGVCRGACEAARAGDADRAADRPRRRPW